MDKVNKATEIIAQKRKLPISLKEKLRKYIFRNLLIVMAIMIYLITINIFYLKQDENTFSFILKVFSMLLIVVDITIFEIGYRKDSLQIWIHGFEVLVCGIIILSLQYIYLYAGSFLKILFMLFPIFYLIYYFAKLAIVYFIEAKKYKNNLSDVKELVKEEVEGYLDD